MIRRCFACLSARWLVLRSDMISQVDRLKITGYLRSMAVLLEQQDPDLPRLWMAIGWELVGGGRQHRVEDSVQYHPFNFSSETVY